MRVSALLLLVVLGACGDESVTVRGSLHPDAAREGLRAWVVGGSAAVPLRDGTFEISGLQPGRVELRIEGEEMEPARLVALDLPAGASLSLRRIRPEEGGLAFPSSIHLTGADLVTVNGIRMADPDALPARVEERGVVLAVGPEGEALLFRPRGDALPDLRVLVTPLTLVDGRNEEREIEDLSPGAAVRIAGPVEEGYLRAERIEIFPGVEEKEPQEERGAAPTRGVRSPPSVDAVEERVEIRERVESREEQREEKRERKERSKEEKRRDRAEIPKGHKPPPGKCRDWIPGLPPGQQPPPRDC